MKRAAGASILGILLVAGGFIFVSSGGSGPKMADCEPLKGLEVSHNEESNVHTLKVPCGDMVNIEEGPQGDYWGVSFDSGGSYIYRFTENWEKTSDTKFISRNGYSAIDIEWAKDSWWVLADKGEKDKILRYDKNWSYTGESYDVTPEGDKQVMKVDYSEGTWNLLSWPLGQMIYQYDDNWEREDSINISQPSQYSINTIAEDPEGGWKVLGSNQDLDATSYQYTDSWAFERNENITLESARDTLHGNEGWWILDKNLNKTKIILSKME